MSLGTSCVPNHEEQEIVFVNIRSPAPIKHEVKTPGTGVNAIWQRGILGKIDPRPLKMACIKGAFDRMLRYGGIIVVMLSAKYEIEYTEGRKHGGSLKKSKDYSLSNWSFSESLQVLRSIRANGIEIEFVQGNMLSTLLRQGAKDASYECTVKPDYPESEHWTPIAIDKFGNDVGGVLLHEKCCMVLLPQMPNFHEIINDFVTNLCMHWRPQLFPDFGSASWLHHERYELPSVIELRQEQKANEEEFRRTTEANAARIEQLQSEGKDWYALLNGTGRDLVLAVKRTLEKLGVEEVIDVDAEGKDDDRNLREDLQIRGNSPILIVDVKGLSGGPEDADVNQAEKHALMRAQEFKGDAKPLTIINHQRNIPPHDRNPNPYRREMISNAELTKNGLMTTWDLFRLLRNKESLKWKDEQVAPVLYRSGRIEPIPEHYTEIGSTVAVWENAFGIVPTVELSTGVRLAVEAGDLFEEIVADSLRVEDKSVESASAGSNCGVGCTNAKRFRKGMRVFVVG